MFMSLLTGCCACGCCPVGVVHTSVQAVQDWSNRGLQAYTNLEKLEAPGQHSVQRPTRVCVLLAETVHLQVLQLGPPRAVPLLAPVADLQQAGTLTQASVST